MIDTFVKFLRGFTLACTMGAALPGCGSSPSHPTPEPTATPSPSLPTDNNPVGLDMVARPAAGGRLQTITGKPLDIYMAVQCCGGASAVLPPGFNTRWPLASEQWIDYVHSRGANAIHFRMGPFYGTVDAESEWADIGGPINPDGTWNEPFWNKVFSLAWHAQRLGMYIEVVVIDTWYCKHAASSWGDQQMPWPQADIDACGVTYTETHDRFVRKVVSTLYPFGNVLWSTDNEGNLIRGWRREWFTSVAAAIRDEESRRGGLIRMRGTNNTDLACDPAFDYVVTHERAPLTQPLCGKWTLNNERNPSLGPSQEASYFAQARTQGLSWALWLAELQGQDVKDLFDKFEAVLGGKAAECFPPPSEDPKWVGGPFAYCPADVLSDINRAEDFVGDRRGGFPQCFSGESKEDCALRQFAYNFKTIDMVSSKMREYGYCAGRSRDAMFAKTPAGEKWYEAHIVAATDGGYVPNPCKGNTWIYKEN